MRRLNSSRLHRLFRWATAPFRSRVVILLYHRVYEASADPWELCVSPGHFAEQLEVLSANYQVIRLNELVRYLEEAQLPERAVVLTFDDGYADNFWNAKPLLEKFRVPATVFVTSDRLDSPTEFWWDDLERALLQPRKLPKSLRLRVQARSYEWLTTNSHERQHAYMAIHEILQPISVSDRNRVMADVFAWAGVDRTGRPDYRPLTTAELIQLGQSELIDIGAHTVTHPFLSSMPEVDQHTEIAGSRKELEKILGRRVDTFSYPYGNLTRDAVNMVAKAGFVAGLATQDEAVRFGANPLMLGRFCVGDWAAKKFRQRLDSFFRA